MTRKEFVTRSIDRLSDLYSLQEAKALAMRVILHFLHLSEYEYLMDSAAAVPKSDLTRLEAAVTELMDSRPIQYVLGYQEFAGHRFKVNESVLIPRPETEQLFRLICDQWRDSQFRELRIFDACTGSGCLAWSLAAAFPKSSVYACDISTGALATASAQKVFVDSRESQPVKNPPFFFKCDVLEGPSELSDIDILVSNPPYVCEQERDFMAANVLDWEPGEALFVPDEDPLRFYRALGGWITDHLSTGGHAWFEINEAFGPQTAELFKSMGLSEVTLYEDLHGKPRFISVVKWF